MTAPVRPWVGFRDAHRDVGYWARLREQSAKWQERHPDKAAEIIAAARTDCGIPAEATTIRPGQQIALDALILEHIRLVKGWPTEEEYRVQLAQSEIGARP